MAIKEKKKNVIESFNNAIENISDIQNMVNIIEYEPNYALTHFIEQLLVKRNGNILRLRIIELTAEGKSAKEIAKILRTGNRYVEQERGKITNLIIDNSDIFKISENKPLIMLTKFYEIYKIHFMLIYNKLKKKKLNVEDYINELYEANESKSVALYPYKFC